MNNTHLYHQDLQNRFPLCAGTFQLVLGSFSNQISPNGAPTHLNVTMWHNFIKHKQKNAPKIKKLEHGAIGYTDKFLVAQDIISTEP